ncbi:MAG: dTMP kinase [Sphingomonadaceae bacterium]|uniref:dTMP kinase n=1 Tax=Thermaurantiacus sp. TaxID=2820283 RepID=UPI00298F0F9E|nr:dTMP kinase [Thermaurantiacus sp.]MCS6987694.1 dTMP kinase [Sphingomonadaceae bacterium]MDW8415087.1 dTMP kinase [Thermaurantiacus sp.]
MFIVLEGGEGVGKSTQAARLAARLERLGRKVVLTREPGGTPEGEAVRGLLVGRLGWCAQAEALLLNAARVQHLKRVIEPALARGAVVVCDRFVHSTLAYQGAGRGLDEAWLMALHRLATGDRWPDLALLLDLPGGRGIDRAQPGWFEGESAAFHARVAAAFRNMGLVHVDASGSPDDVEERIWAAVAARLR